MNAKAWRTLVVRAAAAALLVAVAAFAVSAATRAQAAPALAIISPSDGATVTTNDIIVQVKVSNFNVNCAQMGRPDQDGVGQILALVDGTTTAQLTNFYCGDTFVVPGDGLTPGTHKLAVVLASNTHVPMMDTAQVITINYQPVQPVPLPAAHYTGAPAVALVSPQNGATVPPVFQVQVHPTNFAPTSSLEGKANVPGYGHYHVWVDAPAQPTSLANLVLMPGTNGFTLDLSAWGPGTHTIRIEEAQNDHTMYDPETPVSFTVNVAASASPAASPVAAGTESVSGIRQGITVTTTASVNLRAAPTTSAAVVAVISPGTPLTVTGPAETSSDFTWWPVTNPATGNSGFVAAQLLAPAS